MTSTPSSDKFIVLDNLTNMNKENIGNLFNNFQLYNSANKDTLSLSKNFKKSYNALDSVSSKRKSSYKVGKPWKKGAILNNDLLSVQQYSPLTLFESDNFLFSPKLYSYSQANNKNASFMGFRDQENLRKKTFSISIFSKIHLHEHLSQTNLTKVFLILLIMSKLVFYFCFQLLSFDVLQKIDHLVSFLWQLNLLFQLSQKVTNIDFQITNIVEKPLTSPEYILSLIYVLTPFLLYLALLTIQFSFAEYLIIRKILFSNVTILLFTMEYAGRHYAKVWESYVEYEKSLENVRSATPIKPSPPSPSIVCRQKYTKNTQSSNNSRKLSPHFASSKNTSTLLKVKNQTIKAKSKSQWKSILTWQSIKSAMNIGLFFYYRACIFILKAPFKIKKNLLEQLWDFKRKMWETRKSNQ